MPRQRVARHLIAAISRRRQDIGRDLHASGLEILVRHRDAARSLKGLKGGPLLQLQGIDRDVVGRLGSRKDVLKGRAPGFNSLAGKPAHQVAGHGHPGPLGRSDGGKCLPGPMDVADGRKLVGNERLHADRHARHAGLAELTGKEIRERFGIRFTGELRGVAICAHGAHELDQAVTGQRRLPAAYIRVSIPEPRIGPARVHLIDQALYIAVPGPRAMIRTRSSRNHSTGTSICKTEYEGRGLDIPWPKPR